ncbi:MAG: hypothetical protein QM627_14040 [Luteolibacter sp.]
MKIRTAGFWAAALTGCILAVVVLEFLSPQLIVSRKDGELIYSLDSARQLALALRDYREETGNFPPSLQTLVDRNGLDQETFEKWTKDVCFQYIPPQSRSFDENHILLICQTKNETIFASASGRVWSLKRK